MAQVPYSEGVPGVAPQVSAPNDYQHVQSSPEAFGGGEARGLEKIGAAITKTGEFWGQVQTDDAVNGAMTRVNGVLDKYRSLAGRDALDAQDDTKKQIDEIFKTSRDGLKLPVQQLQYDKATRAYQQRYVAGLISSHADQAAKTHAAQTNRASLDVALSGVANVADDDEHVEAFRDDARAAMVRQVQAEGNGNDRDAVMDAITRADRATYKTQIETVGVENPARALQIADKHKDILGIDYAQLSGHFRNRVNEQRALGVADAAFTATAQNLAPAAPATDTSAVREAILMQESGNRSGAPTSVNGAIGPGQVMPQTFAAYAKEGERIDNPADNRAVSARIVDDLSKKYGGDPARIAVGYFSGPGNVAPADSPTPWVHDIADANGKSVSSYVQDVTSRVSQHGQLLAAKAGVYDRILASTEGQPLIRQAALREVDQRYRAAEVASLADEKARKDAREGSLRKYGDMIRAGSRDQPWKGDPNISEEQVEHLEKLQRDTFREAVEGGSGDYGHGYSQVQSRIYSNGPDQIRNLEQLLPLANSGLINPTGYREAAKHLEEVNKPGAEADKILTGNFYKSAERAITLESDLIPGLKRPGGSVQWNQALPVINRALAEGRSKGMTNAELMDPENKKSIWPVLKPFLPPPSEARAAAMRDAITADAAAKPFDWQTITKMDDALAAYGRHQITREQAAQLVQKHPEWNITMPAVAGPQVPVQ